MAWHSYDFLRKRKDDPKWREQWLQAENQRIAYERERENQRIAWKNKVFISRIFWFIIFFQLLASLGILYNYCVQFGIDDINKFSFSGYLDFYKTAYEKMINLVLSLFR